MLMADVSEPDSIINLIQQASIPSTKAPLNQNSIADYFFGTHEGKRVQFGRVQAGELIGNIDSMEDELKRYYNSADETNQIIEGLISPTRLYMKKASSPVTEHIPQYGTRDLGAKLFCYKVEPSGFIGSGHSFTTARASELYAWIYRLSKVGVITYFTNNWEETARFLITAYKNEQKPPEEHTTFRRIYRPRIQIKDADDFTKALLFLSRAYNWQVGEVKARALADKFVNILDLVTADVGELTAVEGIGQKMAERILSTLGRSNV